MKKQGNTVTSACPSPDKPFLDEFTKGFVRKKARQLAGKFGFNRDEREDIEQQIYLKLAKHLKGADRDHPTWKAFVAITADRCIASMIRDKLAQKRDHRLACSIHVVITADDGQSIELADTLGEGDVPANRVRSQRSQSDEADLKSDLDESVAGLSDERQREFCERLKHDTISQVARDMNIPRTTLNAWLRKLRRRFEDQGLKNYLLRDSSTR